MLNAFRVVLSAMILVNSAFALDACSTATTGSNTAAPVTLLDGGSLGASKFPPADTTNGGQRQPVNGIRCEHKEGRAFHWHSHVSLFVNGEQIAIPQNIGIVGDPSNVCFYWLHTHDETGIVHVETPQGHVFHLADLFAIWGEPLSSNNVAGFS